jgi:mannose-6-phosphate isomerase-like protein (cupin superfamily)
MESHLNHLEFESKYVVRTRSLKRAPGGPPDTRLPRFNRDRFMILGRNSERATGDGGPNLDTGINIACIRCRPGTGFGSHKHPNWEILITLSGTWRITTADDTDVIVGPMDVVAVPGDVYHDAMNIGNDVGYGMSINMGTDTAKFTINPTLVEELAQWASANGLVPPAV